METYVAIPAPNRSDDNEVDLIDYVSEHLGNDSDGWNDFVRALDVAPDRDDSRVSLAGVEITDVSVDGDSVTITYDVEFFAYYGCRDVDGSYVNDALVAEGSVKDGMWVFPIHQYPERQAPNEEL